ncbi:hypothetical protein Hanom_Chr17g01553011 [Helianthus anomalus]
MYPLISPTKSTTKQANKHLTEPPRITSVTRTITIDTRLSDYNNILLHPLIIFNAVFIIIIIIIIITVQSKLRMAHTHTLHFRSKRLILHRSTTHPIPPTNETIPTSNKTHKQRKMTIKLQRSNRSSPMKLRMPFTPNRKIPPTLLLHKTPICNQPRIKRQPHLHKPHPLHNQPNPPPQSRILGTLLSQFKKCGYNTNTNRHKQQIIIPVFDPIGIFLLNIKQKELFNKPE